MNIPPQAQWVWTLTESNQGLWAHIVLWTKTSNGHWVQRAMRKLRIPPDSVLPKEEEWLLEIDHIIPPMLISDWAHKYQVDIRQWAPCSTTQATLLLFNLQAQPDIFPTDIPILKLAHHMYLS